MKLLHKHHLIFGLTSLMFLFGGVLSAQTVFEPHPDSRLWIEGASNVNEFTCHANNYRGEARVGPVSLTSVSIPDPDRQDELFSIWIDIKVDSFDCGKNRMNRDLKNALKADQHPDITFVYIAARTISRPDENRDNYIVEVTGDLTVAGTTRTITFEAEGQYLGNGEMRAEGNKAIKMTDFNVEPPTGLFGLVKAKDELTVHFDLISMLKER